MSRDYMIEEFNTNIYVPTHIPCYTVAGKTGTKNNVSFMFDKTWAELMNVAPEDGGGPSDGFVPVSSALFYSNETKLE